MKQMSRVGAWTWTVNQYSSTAFIHDISKRLKAAYLIKVFKMLNSLRNLYLLRIWPEAEISSFPFYFRVFRILFIGPKNENRSVRKFLPHLLKEGDDWKVTTGSVYFFADGY